MFQEQMDTEPYISTVDDLDKFLEEMDTEFTEPVIPKKVIRFVIYMYKMFINRKCKVTLEILSNIFFFYSL